ncbi:hypothetical protein QA596_12525 [Balneolales bacterium ANBcel1]|nr:hypothetical protein [Balneolales bacterium ANBcel1]
MDYKAWNNILANFFFNESKSEREVFLFITKRDIAKVGELAGVEGNDKEIFNDFILSIKKDCEKYNGLFTIDRPVQILQKWKKDKNQETEYPPYIGYLALFILPLTEPGNNDYNYINYYGRLNDYLRKCNLIDPIYNNNISTPHFKNLDPLWKDLEEWTIIKKNTEWGYFLLHPFSNERWIYAGKPLSQAIFPVYALNKLHQLYDDIHLVPGGQLQEHVIRDIIKKYGEKKLNLDKKVVDIILQTNNEIGHSIIKLIQRNYENWHGIDDSFEHNQEERKQNYVIAELRNCFEIDPVNKRLKHYYRVYSQIEFPEKLVLGDYDPIRYARSGWSNIILVPYTHEINLIDNFNKWKVRSIDKPIRFFVQGSIYNLSGWVEVPKPLQSILNIAVVHSNCKKEFERWKNSFNTGDFRELNYNHPFNECYIFQFINPKSTHPTLKIIDISENTKFILEHGFRVSPNTYLATMLPSIRVEGPLAGNKNVIATTDNREKIILEKKNETLPYWEFPQKFKPFEKALITLENSSEPCIEIKLIDNEDYSNPIKKYHYTKIDKYGNSELILYKINSKFAVSKRLANDSIIKFAYRPNRKWQDSYSQYEFIEYKKSLRNDLILYFLTYKRKCKISDFFNAYEQLLFKESSECLSNDYDIQIMRKLSLRLYYNLGHIETVYQSKEIVVNPPKLILIPTLSGREAILVGGRSINLIRRLFEESKSLGLFVVISKQPDSKAELLAPYKVSIRGRNQHDEKNKFVTIARKCNIKFKEDEYYHHSLIDDCLDVYDYEKSLSPIGRFDDSGFPAREFDIKTLTFRKIYYNLVNKNLSLTEYKINNYTYKMVIWINNIAYSAERDWGRFLILKLSSKQVIFHNKISPSLRTVLVPESTPLPKILDRSLTLMDGLIPESKYLNIKEYKTHFNIYKNVPREFNEELCRKLAQPSLPINHEI